MNDIVRTKKLCKRYKETIALDNVSLHIPQGAIYGLIGNNGAGKTTLMRILSNLQSPSSGTVVKSENIKIGAIIETPALYPTLSAKGNLKYQLKICGCPSKEVKPKIAELLEMVHLKDTRKLVMNYSLGMRQRLALAMALVGNPQFLILDEPLNGLDPEGIKDVRAIIAKLNEEYGVTIMISSHILSELQKVANHYGFLKNGVLIQEFSSSEIVDTDLETFYFKNFLQKQVIAKLAKSLGNLEVKLERIPAFHGFWNEKRILTHFRRTLISHRLYGVGKSYAMRGFKLRMYS